ncbi:MAG: hypothetical protein ACKO5K_17455, partial [Armatimonadota bacterium]
IPDEFEARTWHVVRHGAGHEPIELSTFQVESLRRFEVDVREGTVVGATDDHLYLLPKGRKSRFPMESRPYWTDVAIVPGGERFVAAGVDRTGTGNLVVVGECAGRTVWSREIAFPVACVGVDHAGARIAVGGESGDVLLLDDRRRTCWLHRLETPVSRVVPCGVDECVFLVGGSDGVGTGLGRIGGEGELLWFLPIEGPVRDVAASESGDLVAVAVGGRSGGGRLVLLGASGEPLGEIPTDVEPAGLAMAPSGEYMAVHRRNHRIALFRIRSRSAGASAGVRAAVVEAEAIRAGGDLARAVRRIAEVASTHPGEMECVERWATWLRELRERTWVSAESVAVVGDYREAERRVAEVADLFQADVEWHSRWAELRVAWCRDAIGKAAEESDPTVRGRHWRDALLADPFNRPATAGLADARAQQTCDVVAKATDLLDRECPREALLLLESVPRGSDPESAASALEKRCRIALALAEGHRHYESREYAAAVFQYRKVLSLDPGNRDAEGRLRFAEKLQGDHELDDRFRRLE